MPIPAMSATQRRGETRTDGLAAEFLAKYPVAIANSCRPRQFFTRKSQKCRPSSRVKMTDFVSSGAPRCTWCSKWRARNACSGTKSGPLNSAVTIRSFPLFSPAISQWTPSCIHSPSACCSMPITTKPTSMYGECGCRATTANTMTMAIQLSTIRATTAAGRRAALNRDETPIALIDRPAVQLPLGQQSICHPGCRRDTLSAVPELREYEETAPQEGNDPAHRAQVTQVLKQFARPQIKPP